MDASIDSVTVLDLDGRAVPLASLWGDRPVVLAFIRHFG
jgi:hypothetical protein